MGPPTLPELSLPVRSAEPALDERASSTGCSPTRPLFDEIQGFIFTARPEPGRSRRRGACSRRPSTVAGRDRRSTRTSSRRWRDVARRWSRARPSAARRRAGRGRVLAGPRVCSAARARRGLALRPGAERGDEHARRALVGHLPGDRALPRALRRPRDHRARPRPAEQLVLTENLGRLLGLEGCLSGNAPANAEAPGGRARRAPSSPRTKPVTGRLRARHLHQLRGGRDPGPAAARLDAARPPTRRRPRAPRAARRKPPGQAAAEQDALGEPAEQLGYAQFVARPARAQPEVRARASTKRRGSTTRTSSPRSSSTRRAGATTPKARFAYLFPNSPASAADPGPPQARPDRRGARAGDRARCARRSRMPDCRSCATLSAYTVTGVPVARRGPRRRPAELVARLLLIAALVMALRARARVPRAGCGSLPLVVALGDGRRSPSG